MLVLFTTALICSFTGTTQGYLFNNPRLLLSTTQDIRILGPSPNNPKKYNSSVLHKNVIISQSNQGPPLDYHSRLNKICWVDRANSTIVCDDFDGVKLRNNVEVVATEVALPSRLACDWYTNKLYWTDSETNRIEVVSLERPHHRKVLFWTDLDQPRAIAVHPRSRLLFWTDWGEYPKIERASMDGDPATRQTIVSTDIIWPNGLTIDHDSDRIYFVDAKKLFIDSLNLDGSSRTHVLVSNFPYPFALSMIESKLFWTDWQTFSVHVYDIKRNQTSVVWELGQENPPSDIQVFDEIRQPYFSHPCEHHNCSHMCLLSSSRSRGYTCACPVGVKLLDNYTCADGPKDLLLFAQRTSISLVSLDSPDYTYKVIDLNDLRHTIAVDYDPIDGYIYWSDDVVKKIQRAKLNGSMQEVVISMEIQHPDGIAIDWVARNMYWTDAGTDRIEVFNHKNNRRRVVIFSDLGDPRGIAVAPKLGWLFWSDWNEKQPKIERSNLDGTDRRLIIKNVTWPNGITLDVDHFKMYWCDAKTDKIEYSNMDGTERLVLISELLPHVFGFGLMGDYLYWTDWQRRTVERASKDDGLRRELIAEQIPDIMGLKPISLDGHLGFGDRTNPCQGDNGGCSHFCFFRHDNSTVCACEVGFELAGKKCVKPGTFLLFTQKDKIGGVGIENRGNENTFPISRIHQATSIDYETGTMRIYWSDSSTRTIMRAFLNGSDPQTIVDLGLSSPDSIAIDWLGLNIYWTDPPAQRIEVARLVGTSRRTLLWEEKVRDPHSIVLDPLTGYMYWSEWKNSNSIKKAFMDGTNITTLVTTRGNASDLTLDYERKRIYWFESSSREILSRDLDGNDPKRILGEVFNLVGLSVGGNYLYWGEVAQDGAVVKQMRKGSASSVEVIHRFSPDDGQLTDLLVYHERQRGSNQCAVSNGGCKHLCLTLPPVGPNGALRHTCGCPTHYTLVNGTECLAPQQYLIYSQRNLTVRMLPNNCLESVLPIHFAKVIKAMDFDPLQNFLYWVEGKNKTQSIIKKVDVGGIQASVLVEDSDLFPFDLAVDPVDKLLFWTDAKQNVINVTRLDNGRHFGVVVQVDNEKPRLLAIHTAKRFLFYTDIQSRQLVRTRLDGSHRLVIIGQADILAIAVDPDHDRIVWSQGQIIFVGNLEGDNIHSLVSENHHHKITQLAVLSGWLFWLDRESSQLQRLDLGSGHLGAPCSLQASHISDIISVKEPSGDNRCSQSKCSHMCVLSHESAAPLCACPRGNVLNKDNRTCSPPISCGPERFACADVPAEVEKDCIPITWKCDGTPDCQNGRDELDCPKCDATQFRCTDGNCVAMKSVCDGTADCHDNSDEENCCKDGYQCPNTNVCLQRDLLCDSVDHCADGSDEHVALCSTALKSTSHSTMSLVIIVILVALLTIAGIAYSLVKKYKSTDDINDQSEDSLSPMQPKAHNAKNHKFKRGIPDVVRMSMLTGSTSSYDRNHITGASSSTNGSSMLGYPQETVNPPPSPVTTASSTRGSSNHSSKYRPYKSHRSMYMPPHPTPCSTDVCDESEYNYPSRRYDGEPFPPPPTPRSHCHCDSCPPSPSSRSSTCFAPLPPPPSPVASPPRSYDL